MTEARVQTELAELLERILIQDEVAFSDFYDRTVNRVYGLVFKVLGDQDDSEEVVSDVYAQVWQQVDKYHSDKGSVIGWLLMMARCRAIDFYRKRKSAQQIKHEVELFFDESTLQTDESELLFHVSKSNVDLNLVLNGLSHVQKQLLSLSFYKGLSHSEIAAATNIPAGTVKSHIRRALIALQSVIKE